MSEALTPLLLMMALVLCFAWIGYRAEREQHRITVLGLMHKPNNEAAVLSAIHAALGRIEEKATRIPSCHAAQKYAEPLPGMQVKSQRRRKSQTDWKP